MKKLLRNPEVSKTVLIYMLITVAASAYSFSIGKRFGVFTLFLSLVFILIHFLTTFLRYKKIASLSEELNRILHGNPHISLNSFSEGELAILQSEIYKMTVKLREQEHLLKQDKLFLSNSIADISHQIRTPLTSINLILSFLSDPDITDDRRAELIRDLYGLISQIDFLITALLKISKLDAGTVQFKKENISLRALLDKSVAPLLIPVELKEQSMEITASGNFRGDILWTTEAVANIIKNCHEHSPIGAKITISATETPLFSEIIVSDNGKGIAPEDLPHIFERFYKGKTSDDKGFGIGLNLSKTIILAENGTVKAENITPSGARFIIRFYKGTV